MENWYKHIKEYNWEDATFNPKTGNFTQVVWKNTTELGVGIAYEKGKYVVVCNYNPRGNYKGQFSENVLAPGGKVIEPKLVSTSLFFNINKIYCSFLETTNLQSVRSTQKLSEGAQQVQSTTRCATVAVERRTQHLQSKVC